MHSEDVLCKDCEKKLAHWDMFINIQYEEEWECNGKFRRKTERLWRSRDGKSFLYSLNTDEKHPIQVKTELLDCSLYRETKYCRLCAYKRHFKCGAHKCKGKLVRVRNKDGSNTKHTHGGW